MLTTTSKSNLRPYGTMHAACCGSTSQDARPPVFEKLGKPCYTCVSLQRMKYQGWSGGVTLRGGNARVEHGLQLYQKRDQVLDRVHHGMHIVKWATA